MRILQSYVNDLSEQNEVLVQTVEELEKEANERVALLESKLTKSNSSVKVSDFKLQNIIQGLSGRWLASLLHGHTWLIHLDSCGIEAHNNIYGGHGGRVVTLSPPTSAAGVRSPSWP